MSRTITICKCAAQACVIQTTLRCEKCQVFACSRHMGAHPCEMYQRARAEQERAAAEPSGLVIP